MAHNRHIDEYEADIYTCIRSRCGFCFSNCPIFLAKGLETYTSRGKSMIIKAFLEGKLNLSQELLERFSQCTNCGFCTTNCDVDRPEIFNAFKRDMIDAGFRIGAHERVCGNVLEYGNPFGETKTGLPQNYASKVTKGSDLLYYAGCTARYRERGIMLSMMDILDGFDFFDDGSCCGSVLLRTGRKEDAISAASALTKRLDAYKTVVTSCAGCYNMLTEQYPKLGINVQPRVLHSSQYLAELLDDGKLHLSKIGSGIKATYHDPCHIGRRIGLFDAPRRVIGAMGFELLEMKSTREDALCCGAGGGYKSYDNDTAIEVSAKRVGEAVATGASILITTCPFCVRNLKDGCMGAEIEVVDLVELVSRAKYYPNRL